MKKNITIKDVARETGVHVSTVSRALSTEASSSLSKKVVEQIRSKALEMGYRPNRVALGLRTKKTMSVGVIIPDIGNTIFPPIVRGVESVLEPAGYASILVNTDSDPEREKQFFQVLLERGVDGIIDAAVTSNDPTAVSFSSELPIVTANRMAVGSGIPAVVNDDKGGIYSMVDLLVNAGHQKIGHLAGPSHLYTGIARQEAFSSSMQDRGMEIQKGSIVSADAYSEPAGKEATDKILDICPNLTAILCANDRLAIGALDAIHSRGLKCPEDVSITGFNDIPLLDRIPPGLTTVKILQFDVGRIAAEILIKKMKEKSVPVPETTIMPVSIIERGSVQSPKE
tara:strand:- start:5982 stop:7004 length:1023 start_codon:yes stop_codon:yes gene_type:complete